mmetsp:Transcript_28750/g.54355  ORF Transcript_28750/g.54355 Transcript_28750/m.54355 type:complete len:191 (+) Transcript_28750:144-716(+)
MNDNQNNFVTRSTSRVLAEPGGRSTISLFGNPPPPPPPQAQAALNVTKPNHHDAHATEESNAALAAKIKARSESDHFSLCGLGGTATAAANATDVASSDTNAAAAAAASENHHPNTIHDQNADAAKLIKKKNEDTHFTLFGAPPSSSVKSVTSSNAFASASTTNSYNVITDRPTSRVIQPPGGKTSIILG